MANDLEDVIQGLPQDEETETLLGDLFQIKQKILSLLTQASLGHEEVQTARESQERQKSGLSITDALLRKLETWLNTVGDIVLQNIDRNDEAEIEILIQAHEVGQV